MASTKRSKANGKVEHALYDFCVFWQMASTKREKANRRVEIAISEFRRFEHLAPTKRSKANRRVKIAIRTHRFLRIGPRPNARKRIVDLKTQAT